MPTFPSTGVLDSGVGTNGALNTGNWGGAFGNTSPLQRISNQIGVSSSPQYSYWTGTFGSDQEVYCTLPVMSGTLDFFFRATNISSASIYNMYGLQVGGGTYSVNRYVTGGFAVVQSGSLTAPVANEGLGVRITGSGATVLIEVFKANTSGVWNQTPVLSVSDTDPARITSGSLIALEWEGSGTAGRATNFGGGTVVSATVFTQTVTATTTFTGATVRRAQLVKAATSTFTAAISNKAVSRTLAATTTFTGTIPRQARHTVAATTTFTAAVAALTVKTLTVAATTTFSAVVSTMTYAGATARQFITGRRAGAIQPDDLKNSGNLPQ